MGGEGKGIYVWRLVTGLKPPTERTLEVVAEGEASIASENPEFWGHLAKTVAHVSSSSRLEDKLCVLQAAKLQW